MMSDDQYSSGGRHSAAVESIVERIGVTRTRAIAALRVCNNDLERALRSLSEPWMRPAKQNTRAQRRKLPLNHEADHIQQKLVDPTASNGRDAPEVNPEIGTEPPVLGLLEVLTDDTPDVSSTQHYRLPPIRLQATDHAFSSREGSAQHFSLNRLLWALQNEHISNSDIVEYFSYFQTEATLDAINQCVARIPSIFYAVATNREDIVKTWIAYGGDVNAIDRRYQVPLLAFAILNSLNLKEDTTAIVLILLEHGASASCIPIIGGLSNHEENTEVAGDAKDTAEAMSICSGTGWCNEYFRARFQQALNTTQRYFILRAQGHRQPSKRSWQVAQRYNITRLFTLPYCIIGQDVAIEILTDRLLSHLVVSNPKPLVLFFAGPSGHGKTEVGRRLGSLLSMDTHTSDMTEIKYETDIFGPKAPFHGSERGSPLNNFLAARSGKRAIVVLDEFEKSSRVVMDSLLILFDEGKYVDRRHRKEINCSKIIWILTSNALDSVVSDFWKNSFKRSSAATENSILEAQLQPQVVEEQLQPRLSSAMKSHFGFPLSGRISAIVPFLPFSPNEQTAIAHRCLMQLVRSVRQSISLSHRLVGNVDLKLQDDLAICTTLAGGYYDPDTGARSLELAVKKKIEAPLVREYLAGDDDISEKQPVEEYAVEVKGGHIVIRKL